MDSANAALSADAFQGVRALWPLIATGRGLTVAEFVAAACLWLLAFRCRLSVCCEALRRVGERRGSQERFGPPSAAIRLSRRPAVRGVTAGSA